MVPCGVGCQLPGPPLVILIYKRRSSRASTQNAAQLPKRVPWERAPLVNGSSNSARSMVAHNAANVSVT
jgi:hypothetical protein